MSLEQEDAAAAAVATAPRVTLDAMKAKIAGFNFFTVGDALRALGQPSTPAHDLVTVCVMEMQNGFTLLGRSAPASPENFNAELGKNIAFDDCIRQLWPLEGYELRSRLALREHPGAGVPALLPVGADEPSVVGLSTAGAEPAGVNEPGGVAKSDEIAALGKNEEQDGPSALELGAAARAEGPGSY